MPHFLVIQFDFVDQMLYSSKWHIRWNGIFDQKS